MRGRKGKSYGLLIAAGVAWFPAVASATLTCPSSLNVTDGKCHSMQEPMKGQCIADCAQAKTDCDEAMKTCQQGAASEKGHIAEGAAGSGAAGSAANGIQGSGGAQAPNAANMCNGQKTNQNRAADGQPIPPAMQKCQQSAMKCKDPSGPKAAKAAAANASQNGAENAKRLAEAGEMGQKCEKSAENEGKMPSMPQMPPPPEKKSDASPDSQISDSGLGTSPTVDAQKFDTVKLDSPAGGEVAILGPQGSSAVSGSGSNPGFTAGSGFGPSEISSSSGGLPSGSDSSGGSSAGNGLSYGGSGGLSSSDSDKPEKGIASAVIPPAKSDGQEISNAGGKSVLGLKSKKDDDDEVTVEALVGIPSSPASAAGAANARNLAGTQRAAAQDEGASLFRMVKYRYTELRKIGQI